MRAAERIVGSVIVTRWTNGSSPAGPSRRAAVAHLQLRRAREERCHVAVAARGRAARSRARRPPGPGRIRPRRRRAGARRGSGGSRSGRASQAADQVLVRQAVVRALVVRRHAPLVAPPERDAAPVGLELGGRARRPAPASSRRSARSCRHAWRAAASSEPTSAAGSSTTRSSGGVAMFMVARVRDLWLPRRAGRRSRGRPTRRRARAARRFPRPRRAGPRARRRASRGRDRGPGLARTGRALPARRRRPTTGRGRARARAAARRRRSASSSAPRGRVPRQRRISAAPRRAPSPRLRKPGRREAAEVGGGRRGVQAVELRACTRGSRAVRSGARGLPGSAGRPPRGAARAPRSRCASAAGRAGAGSTLRAAGRRRSGAGTRSGRRPGRARSARARRPTSLSAATRIAPSGAWPACTRSSSSVDRDRRAQQPVAHLARRVARVAAGERSEYGPAGREPGLDGKLPHWRRSCSRRQTASTKCAAQVAHAGKQFPSNDGLVSRRCCAGSRRGCPCGAASGSSGSSSSRSSPGRRRRSSTSASPTRRSAAARPTTSSRLATRGRERITGVGRHGARSLSRRVPGDPGGARRRARAALRRRRVRPGVLECGRRARRRWPRRPAPVRARALPRRAAGCS